MIAFLLSLVIGICITLVLAAIFVPAEDPWIDGEGGFNLDEYRRQYREENGLQYEAKHVDNG